MRPARRHMSLALNAQADLDVGLLPLFTGIDPEARGIERFAGSVSDRKLGDGRHVGL